jgi:hypothetical protein
LRAHLDQPVLAVIAIDITTIGGEIAIGIVAESCAASGSVLVEAVCGVAARDIDMPVPETSSGQAPALRPISAPVLVVIATMPPRRSAWR